MRLIVFSSPLHFLVALLVKQSDGVESVGLYLRHQKDCSETFAKIAEKLGVDLRYVTSMESLDQNFSEVVITNRFDPVQVALIEKYRRKATIAFMEEGASIYLKELHFSKGLSDGNRWLRLKELFRVVIGKGRRFIPMSWFEKGYSFCAAEIPFLSKRCELINLTDVFRATVRNSNIDKSGGGKKSLFCLSGLLRNKFCQRMRCWHSTAGSWKENCRGMTLFITNLIHGMRLNLLIG